MQDQILVIRKVNRGVYKRFRQKALEEESSVGDAVTEAMRCWLEEKKKGGKAGIKTLPRLNGIVKAGKRVRWSEQIDDVLYGGTA